MYTVPKDIMKKPGGLVYMDVKHIRIKREKWYQFTALDHATRMLKTKIYKQINSKSTVEFLSYVSKNYPFLHIKYIGTDNGSEFMGEFDRRLKEQEIKHIFSSPASPKQNPYVERVIRTIIEQQYEMYGIEDTPKLQQQALEDFCVRYNEKRPHQSLNFLTPQEMCVKLSRQ